jgi:hypothetical protein
MNTTKKLMTLLLAMLPCMSASAQVQFGAKVGLDLTNFWGKDVDHHLVLNYQAGLVMEWQFNPYFGIGPEVVFAAQGGQEKTIDRGMNGSLLEVDERYHMNYINVPVMFKYYPTQDFSIDFGPQIGFNVYSKSTVGEHKTDNHKNMTHAVDFGLGLVCTYELDKNAFIQVRYTLGLTKAFKEEHYPIYYFTMDYPEGVADYPEGDIINNYRKNGNIQLAFGMKF